MVQELRIHLAMQRVGKEKRGRGGRWGLHGISLPGGEFGRLKDPTCCGTIKPVARATARVHVSQ